jgi:hypothetical protein
MIRRRKESITGVHNFSSVYYRWEFEGISRDRWLAALSWRNGAVRHTNKLGFISTMYASERLSHQSFIRLAGQHLFTIDQDKDTMYADLNKPDLRRNFDLDINDFEVNINDASEVRRWMQHWDITEVELRKTVAEVGTEVEAVRIALGK